MWKIIRIASFTMIFGIAYLCTVLAIALSLAGLPVAALNAVIIWACCIPALFFLLWIAKEYRNPVIKRQNIVAGIWIISLSTVLAHVATRIPMSVVTTVILTTILEVAAGLPLYHVTRKLYKNGRQKNIAAASGKPLDDPDVRNLADNQDLAIAIVAGMMLTTKSITIMQSDFAPFLMPDTTRVIAILLGSSTGIITFNFCPNQTKTREFIARSTVPKG